ncbi:MAG TPA: UDP-N-acetylglucosamine--N-acetylmuramyl-(pentapeptide) pyrophosphoryl-undecaprenol N-acetylglucosamine transferase [Candidatus Dormibacteraeota bacterium]|nr:UDP-N-acetylglucosamine--N-acetylmuramyl-(pentapeptide) pyrophosphoryl-undecaprenol N-acetylglucosamine transferase [Candidatus Dormibacteraeota bacterium]
MTIVLTGGGSGGHITPILAVAAELKRLNPETHLVYIGHKGDSLGDIPASDPNIDQVFVVRAGKFRRFHGEGLRQLLDVPTMLKNIRDALYVVIGTYQSWRLMRHIRPSVVFSRGGFVSVPVAIGAKLQGVPYITHDSDLIPSLANRLIAPWAKLHAVAYKEELYPYAADKTVTTGIPLNKYFKLVTSELQKNYKDQLDIPHQSKLVFIIGGGLGSQEVNSAVADAVPHLLEDFKNLYVIHAAGRGNQAELQSKYNVTVTDEDRQRLQVHDFISDVYRYSGAADIIVTRAGATNLAEFAMQGKACIVIPSSFLAGGHQLKNAEYLAEQGAALVLKTDDLIADPNRLARYITDLLQASDKRKKLETEFAKLAQPNAAHKIAKLILEQV